LGWSVGDDVFDEDAFLAGFDGDAEPGLGLDRLLEQSLGSSGKGRKEREEERE
jgi:hypothetical protein